MKCIVAGCQETAGTPWGPYYCPRHDAERLERIEAGLTAAARRLAQIAEEAAEPQETGEAHGTR